MVPRLGRSRSVNEGRSAGGQGRPACSKDPGWHCFLSWLTAGKRRGKEKV
jgi:hypothetical protein